MVSSSLSPPNVHIITPLYNDWLSFGLLVEQMEQLLPAELKARLRVVVVNDGSTLPAPSPLTPPTSIPIEVVHLSRNMGHQKAIAIGLARAAANSPAALTLVMDSDGEDQVAHIGPLLEKAHDAQKIVFAQRSKRTESLLFKVFYRLYRFLFYVLIGKSITFGNFCVIPRHALRRLVFVSEIWNNFPGGTIRSRLPYTTLLLDRGKRLAGQSKMNFTALVLHGLGAISVHVDVVAVRILIFSFLLIVSSVVGMGIVAYIRLFTDIAYPGWATSFVVGLFTIVLQAFLVSLFLVFIVLNYRSQRLFVPATDFAPYVLETEQFPPTA